MQNHLENNQTDGSEHWTVFHCLHCALCETKAGLRPWKLCVNWLVLFHVKKQNKHVYCNWVTLSKSSFKSFVIFIVCLYGAHYQVTTKINLLVINYDWIKIISSQYDFAEIKWMIAVNYYQLSNWTTAVLMWIVSIVNLYCERLCVSVAVIYDTVSLSLLDYFLNSSRKKKKYLC